MTGLKTPKQMFTYVGVHTQSRLGHCSSVYSVYAVLAIRHTHAHTHTNKDKHTHLSTFCGIKIGVKRDTLICRLGHSPARAGLYGLLWRRREGSTEGRKEGGGAVEKKEK